MSARILAAWIIGLGCFLTLQATALAEHPHRAVPGYSLQRPAARRAATRRNDLLYWLSVKGGSDVTTSRDEDGAGMLALRNRMANDNVLALLARARELKWISVTPCFPGTVTDAGLAHLQGLNGLEALHLFGTSVTSDGLSNLSGLSNLRSLQLGGRVDDAGMSHLIPLEKLEHLNLYSADVGDAGLAAVSQLCCLRILDLQATSVTNAGMADLQPLINLEVLDLSDTACTAEGIASLAGQIDNDLMCMLGTFRLKTLHMRQGPDLEETYRKNIVRVLGMSNLQTFPSPAVVANWRSYIDGWRGLGAYVEFRSALDLHAVDRANEVVGLYFLGPPADIFNDELTLGVLPKNLERLSLRDMPVTDAGLAVLSQGGYARLAEINVHGCRDITQAGLAALADLPALTTIFVDPTLVPAPAALRPGLEIKPLPADYPCPQCCAHPPWTTPPGPYDSGSDQPFNATAVEIQASNGSE